MSDIEREEFEQAVADKWSDSYKFTRFGDEDYYDEVLEGMWWGWQAGRQALEGEAVDVERIADTVRDYLGDIFECTRVWEAWQVGTMTQNDFTPADETELADDIAGAVATLYTHPASRQAVSVPEWTDINLRQPEEYQYVLWFCQGGNIRTGMYYGKTHCDRVPETHPISRRGRSHYGKFGRYADPAESGHVVTHWMPLPCPPKQEEGQ